jgi:hypothetical protein
MSSDSSPPTLDLGQKSWDEYLWDELFEYLDKQQVIPIIGPGVALVDVDGRALSVEQYTAEQLLLKLPAPIEQMPPSPTLAEVARILARARADSGLYSRVKKIIEEAPFGPPETLRQLAEITDFKLFVTTTSDSLLESAIDTARYGGDKTTESLCFVPNKPDDLSEHVRELRDLPRPVVYHLLGKPSAIPGSYVVSDGDLLEFIHALQSESRPKRLFDELKNNHLLFLGGTFSDWVVRLFLRLAKGQPLSYPRAQLEVLADERSRTDTALVSFLESFSPQTKVFYANGPKFVAELWSRWSQVKRRTSGDPPPSTAKRTIFLSYCREDQAAANTLYAELKQDGFDVWMDKDRLDAVAYDPIIKQEVETCAAFVALLSRNTHNQKTGAYFRREWTWAIKRDTYNADDVVFIVPVVVDDFSRGDFDDVPYEIRAKDIKRGLGGHVTEELRRALRKALGEPA